MMLVVGATGILGSAICRQLVDQGKAVRALVRGTSDPKKTAALESQGVELFLGDLKNPALLEGAFQGVTHVISTASSTLSRAEGDSIQSVDLEGQLQLVDTAKAAGVQQFVYTSFVKKPENPFPLSDTKAEVEDHLKASGMTYTILESNFSMEVWMSPLLGFDYANASVRIYGDGQSKLNWVSFADVAKFAVMVLDNPEAKNETIQVGGPEALSTLEVVKIFEEVSGKSFATEHVPVEVLQDQKKNAPDPLQASFSGLMLICASGNPMDMQQTLQKFPVQLVSVREYARQVQ